MQRYANESALFSSKLTSLSSLHRLHHRFGHVLIHYDSFGGEKIKAHRFPSKRPDILKSKDDSIFIAHALRIRVAIYTFHALTRSDVMCAGKDG